MSFRLAIAAVVCLASFESVAQSPADFYRGKTVDLLIGYGVGGGYDVYGRAIARHIGKHIPGEPNVVVKNLDGAGGLRLANHMYQVAARDGLALATTGRSAAFDPLFGNKAAQFDGSKFGWVGSANSEVSVCVALKDAGVNRFEDLYTKELIIAGTAAANDTDQIPKVINGLLGTKFKLTTGYPTGNGVNLSMERRETYGRCGWSWSSIKATHNHWIESGELRMLVQVALSKHPDLPEVPLIGELARTDEQRQILRVLFASQVLGRPFFTTPDAPPERLAALRKAFLDTLNDKQFMEEAEKAKLEITPVSGAEVQALVADIYSTPRDIAEKAGALMR